MTSLMKFDFNAHPIRVVTVDGAPWFVAMDVREVLDLALHGQWLGSLSADEKRTITKRGQTSLDALFPGRVARAQLVSESGLYKLVLRSDKPAIRPFQDWVTKVVLPAIRKDGGYILGEEKVSTGDMSEDELVLKAMEVMRRKIDRLSVA